MGSVTAKAFLSNRVEQDDHVDLAFYADYSDGKNKEWADKTPTLSVSMRVKKEVADQHFPVGTTSYTLTFEANPKEDTDGGDSSA